MVGGCTELDHATVQVNPLPTINIAVDSALGCAPFNAYYSNNTTPTPETTMWYFGVGSNLGVNTSGNESQSYKYNDAGNYSITASAITEYGCSSTETFQNIVRVLPKPEALFSFDPKSPTTLESSVEFESMSNVGIENWKWDFNDDLSPNFGSLSDAETEHSFSGAGNYAVDLSITDSSGCSDTITRVVYVKADHVIYVPDAFSPNGDGLNEIYKPVGLGISPSGYELYIYSRWGEQLYHGTNIEEGWNGKKGSKKIPTGTYHYILKYKDLEGASFEKQGLVEVVF